MDYRSFVKNHIHDPKFSHLKQTDKIKEIAKLWREHKASGGGLLSDGLSLLGLGLKKPKKTRVHAKKNAKGAGVLSSLLDDIGLGLEKPKRKGKKVKGGGILSDALDSIGLGLEKPKRKGKKVKGAGIEELPFDIASHWLDSLGGSMNKKKGKHSKKDLERIHAGSLLGSFLAGVTAPFRALDSIVPGPWSVVSRIADTTGVPTVSDVINQ